MDIRIKQKTTKLCFFTNTKDKTRPLSQFNVIYEFTCPGCNSLYICKTNKTQFVCTQEHALTDKESAIYKHLHHCDQIKHIQGLYNLPDTFINENNPTFCCKEQRISHPNRAWRDNWNLLLYKEAYHIKRSAPSLNIALKDSRELCLFSSKYRLHGSSL